MFDDTTQDGPPPLIAGRFRVVRALGMGGQGQVLLAADLIRGDEQVALKLVRPTTEQARLRMQQEIDVLRGLDVPGVVRFVDDGITQDGALYLATEYVDGRPFPGRPGPVRWAELRPTAEWLLECVGQVHARGYVHRDLKPDNVLVRRDGRPVLLDFGIAHAAGRTALLTQAGTVLGTPAYLSPEQAGGQPCGPAADLFALGVMLFEALTGAQPFQSQSWRGLLMARMVKDAPSLRTRPHGGAPGHVVDLVDALLQRDPKARPRSAVQALARLRGDQSRGPRLPWLGARAPLDALEAAADAGRPLVVQGAPGLGKSRCLKHIAERLVQGGRALDWVQPFPGPFAPLIRALGAAPPADLSLDDARAWLVDQTRARLATGAALLVDDADRIEPLSRAVLAEAAQGGGALYAADWADTGLPECRLRPLDAPALAGLFVGPERVFHLRSEPAEHLLRQSDGVPSRVAQVVEAWTSRGWATPDADGRLALSEGGLRRLRQGYAALAIDDEPLSEAGQVAAQAPALDWIALASEGLPLTALATAMEAPVWAVEAQVQALQARGAVVSIGGRLRARISPVSLFRWSLDERQAAHGRLADVSPLGSEPRLRHLTSAGRLEEAADEALRLGRARLREGALAQALAAAWQGVQAARRGSGSLSMARVTEAAALLAQVALVDRRAAACREARLALTQLGVRPDLGALLDMAERAHADPPQALLAELQATPAFEETPLERVRLDLHSRIARRCTLAVHRQIVAALMAQAAGPGFEGDRLSWRGRLAYREGHFAQATVLFNAAAERFDGPLDRLEARTRAAASALADYRPHAARDAGETALSLARRARHAHLETRAEWTLRAAAFQLGEAHGVDHELVAAVDRLGIDELAAMVWYTEAAVARSQGARALAASLADRAAARFEAQGRRWTAALMRATALDARGGGGEAADLMAEAQHCNVAGMGLQIAALVAPFTDARPPPGLFERWCAAIPTRAHGIPIDVLSVAEARGRWAR